MKRIGNIYGEVEPHVELKPFNSEPAQNQSIIERIPKELINDIIFKSIEDVVKFKLIREIIQNCRQVSKKWKNYAEKASTIYVNNKVAPDFHILRWIYGENLEDFLKRKGDEITYYDPTDYDGESVECGDKFINTVLKLPNLSDIRLPEDFDEEFIIDWVDAQCPDLKFPDLKFPNLECPNLKSIQRMELYCSFPKETFELINSSFPNLKHLVLNNSNRIDLNAITCLKKLEKLEIGQTLETSDCTFITDNFLKLKVLTANSKLGDENISVFTNCKRFDKIEKLELKMNIFFK